MRFTWSGPLVTKCKVNLARGSDQRLKAYASVVLLDAVAINRIRILQLGTDQHERMLVEFPSQERRQLCPSCQQIANPLGSYRCRKCGADLSQLRHQALAECADGRQHRYQQFVHPVTSEARAAIESAVLAEYFCESALLPNC